MGSNTLDDLGRQLLEAVAGGQTTDEELEAAFDVPRADLEARVAQLADNALIREADGRYELTENGLRLLNATPTGTRDNRIDTPPRIDEAIETFDLRPDREEAVRNAFAFLRYWGDATTAELLDGTYSEEPADYETPERWWNECVRERLEALPDVRFTPDASIGEIWTYEGESVVDQPDEDGRDVEDLTSAPPLFGSARHTIEKRCSSDAERTAARAAFAMLYSRGEVTTDELVERLYDDRPAGCESVDEWTAWLAGVFDEIPDVERLQGTEDGARFQYRQWAPDDESRRGSDGGR